MSRWGRGLVLMLAGALAACGRAAAPAMRPPSDSAIPAGPLGLSIRRGRALLVATRDSLPAHVGNRLRCSSCHLDAGRRASGTWVGAFARYPQYRSRSNSVETIEYRINDCFRRSMNGSALATDGPDMRDIVAYLAFLSNGLAVGPPQIPANARLAKWAAFTADTGDGARVYGQTCARCHGPAGGGGALGPPLWGLESYNIGAGMARVRTAAAFIKDNMPFDAPGSLADQQAFDVAAYVNAQSRPDFPDKAQDWPKGDAPPDVAYRTLGAGPARPPR